jgi:hypothetical protein
MSTSLTRMSRLSRGATGIAVATLLTAGCGTPELRGIARPSGQALVAVIASGYVDASVPWQTEVIRQNSELCTQAVVRFTIMSGECDFTVETNRPVNFEVEGNDTILFVDGVVDRSVSRLTFVTRHRPNGIDLTLSDPVPDGELRYFGYAAAPGDVVDLVAYDSAGRKTYSGGEKITGMRGTIPVN